MTVYLAAWAVATTVGCFVITAMVVGVEIRDYRRSKAGRLPASLARVARDPEPAPVPRIPAQRKPSDSAAAIVTVGDPAAYEAFLGELIVTAHVEEALS